MESVGDDYDIHLFDIEGCFPNMPKEAILLATLDVMANAKRNNIQGVWVPRARSKAPSFQIPSK